MQETFELRTKPTQERSAAKFDRILDTAIILLETEGWDGFSTNALAERAGIGIQTLYRYFPNKLSVVATLAQRIILEWNEWFSDFDSLIAEDLQNSSNNAFLLFIENLKNQPGGVAIRRAMNASPALRKLDREDNRKMAKEFSSALFRHLNLDNPEQFYPAALTVIEASLAITDLTFESPEDEAKQLINEFILMQNLFIQERVKQVTEATHAKEKAKNEKTP
ncbi:MAG: TetR/AcrR family transcriptional regulator [Halioglobus sp.]